MTETVTALFESEERAAEAASRLEQAGIPGDRVDIWSTPHNLPALLEYGGLSRSDANAYTEAVIRGGTVVIVTCEEAEIDTVVGILDQAGAVDPTEQENS